MAKQSAHKTDLARRKKALALKKVAYPARVVGLYKEALGRRLAATRELYPGRVLAGDLHMHTTFSDGIGTVAEMKAVADLCGLDFIFVTDHRSLRQKQACRRFEAVWWGQEPGSARHHLALLDPKHLFKPKRVSVAEDLAAARRIAPFVFIPHPVGWWPGTWYEDEAVDRLRHLGDEFAIEVINGANKLTRAYDQFDEKAVRVWDGLLCEGKRVTALGASDAHLPAGVGCVWTGVFAERRDKDAVIAALRAGHTFASEAPLLALECDEAIMGDTIRLKRGARIKVGVFAADSAGLHSVRLIHNGKAVRSRRLNDKPTASFEYEARASAGYYRLECTASDQRRAFSTPMYVETA